MKIVSSKLVDPEKKKKGEKSAPEKEERGAWNQRKGATPKTGWGGKESQQYAGAPAPRVGGKAETPSSPMAKGTSDKKLIKKSKSNVRKSGASKAAKMSALRAYGK